jgi:hypothetical protein
MAVTNDPRPARTEESVAEQFPDRGEPPSNEVVVERDAPAVPNTGHPK